MFPWILAALGLGALAMWRKGSSVYQTVPLPDPRPEDWEGWVWPIPIHDGRIPQVSQEWKPGHDPGVGHSSGKTANHLGVDIMYPKRAGDPPGAVKHDASSHFIAPAGIPVLAAGPGKIWGTYQSAYGLSVLVDHGNVNQNLGGVNTFYQHLSALARDWKKGDEVKPGDVLGTWGFSTAQADGEQLRHLHFELRFPRSGYDPDAWRIDARPYMRFWRMLKDPTEQPGVA